MVDINQSEYPLLIKREFLTVDADINKETFRVYQWNVLADGLSSSSPTENFCVAPSECLQWKYRSKIILMQIIAAAADVICLEEVDHYYDFFEPELKKLGYSGLFIPKKNSPCLKFPGNNGPDGIAMFYLTEKFLMRDYFTDYLPDEKNGEKGQQGFLTMWLEDLRHKKDFLVAVSHLKAKHEFSSRRLVQTESALEKLKKIVDEKEVKSVIWCGDFNGEPDEPYYNKIKTSDLKLESAYFKVLGEEIPFSTWKVRPGKEEKRNIDYIWYSKGTLQVNGVLLPMSVEHIPSTRFPSLDHGSDHISLCADFSFI